MVSGGANIFRRTKRKKGQWILEWSRALGASLRNEADSRKQNSHAEIKSHDRNWCERIGTDGMHNYHYTLSLRFVRPAIECVAMWRPAAG